jgi:uncharacterized protein
MSKKYQVTCDLFTIPLQRNSFLLYAPRVGFMCEANNDGLNLLANLDDIDSCNLNEKQNKVLNQLEEAGVLNGSKERVIQKYKPCEYAPTKLTLFPTNQCNLRCIYCYASAGDHNPKTMEWHYAETAINTIIENAKKIGSNSISIGFHGGGEPLFRWDFIKEVTYYAETQSRENNLNLNLYSATNGVLNEKQLKWITEHFSDLNISFDGLPQVQDYHRPLPNGEGSFKFLHRTFRFLDKKGFNYGIRSTFSDYNIDMIEKSYNFIIQNYKPKSIHFEPVFQCGRCKTNNNFNVSLEKFAASFQNIEAKHNNKKIRFIYSGSRLETLTDSFCGVSHDSFTVTPDGFITACFEITSVENPISERFFYGRISDQGKVMIYEDKRKYLQDITVENLDYCKNCFAKWHCAGDCVAKIGHADLLGDRGHDRCQLNRQMLKDKLIAILKTDRP